MSATHEALREMLAVLPPYNPQHDAHVMTMEEVRKLHNAFNRVSHIAVYQAEQCEAHRKPDRVALLQMAATIAAGMCADPSGLNYERCGDNNWYRHERNTTPGLLASRAVSLARTIIAEVDKEQST